MRIRELPSRDLRPREISAIRELLEAGFADDEEGFGDEDWGHALGGRHFLLDDDGLIVAHAAVVERELQTGGHCLATGYVEALATLPSRQGQEHGSRVMGAVEKHVDGGVPAGGTLLGGNDLVCAPWLAAMARRDLRPSRRPARPHAR